MTQRGRSDTHRCPWDGCDAQVSRQMWGCSRHWYQLPAELRAKLWGAYADHGIGSEEHTEALDAIDAWLEGRDVATGC